MTQLIKIRRDDPFNGKESTQFVLEFQGRTYSFKLNEVYAVNEFRPLLRFDCKPGGVNEHIIAVSPECAYLITVDNNSSSIVRIIRQGPDGGECDSMEIPSDHDFFKYVLIQYPMAKLLGNYFPISYLDKSTD